MRNFKDFKKNEKGGFLMLVPFIMVGILLFAGLFLNIVSTYMTVNFSKKAIQESARIRALATDIPLKENTGVLEVINSPYSGSNLYASRPKSWFGEAEVKSVTSPEYLEAVEHADNIAKEGMIKSINSFVGNSIYGSPLVFVKPENICFDVKPLPQNTGNVTFACPLKTLDGTLHTVKYTAEVSGYDDLSKGNKFTDVTLSGETVDVKVSNAVFAAAVIEPRSFINTAMYRLGFTDHRTKTVIYGVAYPQIDSCYGEFCSVTPTP